MHAREHKHTYANALLVTYAYAYVSRQLACHACRRACARLRLRSRPPSALPPASTRTYTYTYMHILDAACECARLDLGWPYQHPRAWNAQVSQCICHVGLSRKWGSIPNVWSLPRSSAVRHVRARAHNMFIHMAAAEDGVWDVTAIADAPGRLMPTELG